MAVFNLRGIRDDLARMVKATAASEGKTLVEFTVELYEGAVRRGGWPAAKMEGNDEQIAKPGKRGKGGQAVEQGIESARIRSEVGGKEGAGGEAVGKTKTIADGGNIGDVAAVEFVRAPELTEGKKMQGWELNTRVPAVAPEWKCVCGSTGKRMKGKELVCFSCGRGVRESGNGF